MATSSGLAQPRVATTEYRLRTGVKSSAERETVGTTRELGEAVSQEDRCWED